MIRFFDYEASGLDAESYPIQVAWCDVNGVGESHYIIPKDEWTYWDFHAQRDVHHISRSMLYEQGKPVEIIIELMEKALMCRDVYCDGGHLDEHWHEQLYGDNTPTFWLNDYFAFLYDVVDPFNRKPKLPHFYTEVRAAARLECPPTHDALADCQFLATGYRLAKAL